MIDIDFYPSAGSDWPVSAVKPRRVARMELSQWLEGFAGLELSDQDHGFLRLAEIILQVEPEGASRRCTEIDAGLIS